MKLSRLLTQTLKRLARDMAKAAAKAFVLKKPR